VCVKERERERERERIEGEERGRKGVDLALATQYEPNRISSGTAEGDRGVIVSH